MAVRIDVDALLESLPAEIRAEAARSMRLRSLRSSDGGARAAVTSPDSRTLDCWVGVRGGALTANCECGSREPICAHAVVVTQAAVEAGLPWSTGSTAPRSPGRGRAQEPALREWIDVAVGLTHRELVELVAQQAVRDRAFAADLLKAAALLGPPSPEQIAAVRAAIGDALAVESSYRWDLHDIAKAGYRLAEELSLLARRPATAEALRVAEEAIEAWDGHLYAALGQDFETYETEPAEIGGLIAAAHLALCESLEPDPHRLAADLVRLEALAEIESSIDVAAYKHLLGADGVAAYKEGKKQLRRTRGW